MNNKAKEKKSAADILIETFLKDVDEKGTMPWQRPYERYDSFNYFSQKMYRGFNRLLLPFGEYITKNQINTYNKEHGYLKIENGKVVGMTPEAFRFQKGIQWWPVVFFTVQKKPVSKDEIAKAFPGEENTPYTGVVKCIGRDSSGYTYILDEDGFFKTRNVLKYYQVADRHYFKNEKGECLPSRIETGEISITKSKPQAVIDSYIKRSGVKVITDYAGIPCYSPNDDTVKLNPHVRSEDSWFATAFHEFAHSTGAENRLNRPRVGGNDISQTATAEEECIAEMTACLCCAETDITDFKTSGMADYENNVAYVQAWKKRVIDWGSKFIFLCSQADKAFNYICEGVDVLEEDESGDE